MDRAVHSSVESGFLIEGPRESCRECWSCVRVCPARAIRVVDRRSEVIHARCVKCGACVTACPRGGHTVRDDLPLVRELLDGERPVVALLATEFVAALHPMSHAEVEIAVEEAGFFSVETTLLGEEMIALEYEQYHDKQTGSIVLRSTCPVAVEWVRRFHPALVSALAPVVPPYVAQARLIKALYPEDVAVAYVSPCFARKDEFTDPAFGGAVDVAIDFGELRHLLAASSRWATSSVGTPPGSRRPALVKELSLIDGFPRRTLASYDMTSRNVVAVRGLKEMDELLGAIERQETGPFVVDMLCCDGCIDGPATGSELSVFAKRAIVSSLDRSRPPMPVDTTSLLAHLPEVELARSFSSEPVSRRAFSAEEIDACLAGGEFDRETVLDCGACGHETCVEHAKAILAGDSTWEMCFPLQHRRLEQANSMLRESATLDPLTGLWNRRVFAERLESEVARFLRYGTPATLLMIDIDGFKAVNDRYGHVTGDAVLSATAGVMKDVLRETDITARYGGDEFALILPGVGKTAGFAVAEKLREAVADRKIPVSGSEHDGEVSVTISVGLASTGPDITCPEGLLEAADRALYRAKGQGRDQVRIAPG